MEKTQKPKCGQTQSNEIKKDDRSRQEKFDDICKKRDDYLKEVCHPISDEKLELIEQLTQKRNEAIAYMEKASNETERTKRKEEIDFIGKHKALIRAYGLTPCEADDCAKYLTGQQRKYCSTSCRDKQRSRKWRRENPDKKAISNKKYLNKYYTEK